MGSFKPSDVFYIHDCAKRAHATLSYIETRFGDGPYLLGEDFTVADIMMGFTLMGAQMLDQLGENFPKLSAYLMCLMQRHALQRTLKHYHKKCYSVAH